MNTRPDRKSKEEAIEVMRSLNVGQEIVYQSEQYGKKRGFYTLTRRGLVDWKKEIAGHVLVSARQMRWSEQLEEWVLINRRFYLDQYRMVELEQC